MEIKDFKEKEIRNKDFNDLIECPLTGPNYYNKLKL